MGPVVWGTARKCLGIGGWREWGRAGRRRGSRPSWQWLCRVGNDARAGLLEDAGQI